MPGRLDGKTAIITGGAGSLGLATTKLFLDEGANVTIVDFDNDALQKAAKGLDPERLLTIQGDVTSAEDTKNYVAKTLEKFGQLDILFSNAGNHSPIAPVTEFPEDAFDRVMAVHVKGTFLALKYSLNAMNDGGAVIITSSITGTQGVPNNIAYTAAKHALVGVTRGVAKEVGRRNIRVNAINPAPVDNEYMRTAERQIKEKTGMDIAAIYDQKILLGRHMQPEEVASGVLFLASSDASFVTGHCLMVDGGLMA